MQYVVYPEPHEDPKISSLIASYDPKSEILIHYMDDQRRIHTTRLQTATNARQPEVLWMRHCFLRRPSLTPEEIQRSTFSDDGNLAI
jgi:hypothetical protein